MKKKILAVSSLLMAAITVGSLAACGGSGSEQKINASKTQLYVFNFNGGYGSAWLDEVSKDFEELYKDEVFEEGKKGVEIVVKNQKTRPGEGDNLGAMKQEIFFTESSDYYGMYNANQMLDITDMVKDTLDEFGETRSIYDKMEPEQQAYYSIDEKIYAVPHYLSAYGIAYNADVFNEGYWILKEGYNAATIETEYESGKTVDDTNSISFGKPNADRTNLSAGVDGEYGTYDDGLPATYAEFYLLCNKLAGGGINALHWGGAHYANYGKMLMTSLAAANEGKEQMSLNYSYDSSIQAKNIITGFDANGDPIIGEPVSIDANKESVVTLSQQAGKYYAIEFMYNAYKNTTWFDQTNGKLFSSQHSHTDAQRDFLRAGMSSTPKKIAMLFDGTWWESEASSVFTEMAEFYGSKYEKLSRNFGNMPLPHAKASQIGVVKTTLYDMYAATGFIKSNIAEWKIPLAKLFLKYTRSDEAMRTYTRVSNTLIALNYELKDEDLQEMSAYGRSLYQTKVNGDVVYSLSGNPFFLSNKSKFTWDNMYTGIVNTPGIQGNGARVATPLTYFPAAISTPAGLPTAAQYLGYMKLYAEQNSF